MMGYWRIVLAVLLALTTAAWLLALIGTASLQVRQRERESRALGALPRHAQPPTPPFPLAALPPPSTTTPLTHKPLFPSSTLPNTPQTPPSPHPNTQAVCTPSSLPEIHAASGAPFRPALGCGAVLRLPWALLVVEALLLVGTGLSLCLGGLAHSAMSWLAAFSVMTALCVFVSDALAALQTGQGLFGAASEEGDRARTSQAGWIAMSIGNALLAWWCGWRQQPSGARHGALPTATGAGGVGGGVSPIKY